MRRVRNQTGHLSARSMGWSSPTSPGFWCPYSSMLLADMGADVIKVESKQGDDTRSWTPPERDDVSTYFRA